MLHNTLVRSQDYVDHFHLRLLSRQMNPQCSKNILKAPINTVLMPNFTILFIP